LTVGAFVGFVFTTISIAFIQGHVEGSSVMQGLPTADQTPAAATQAAPPVATEAPAPEATARTAEETGAPAASAESASEEPAPAPVPTGQP
ncbi:MAG: hypothetical protein KDB94_04370, partial [Acidobacteria bacterium]|nr:hypothetical protein [Acidobacteriota bacterium]